MIVEVVGEMFMPLVLAMIINDADAGVLTVGSSIGYAGALALIALLMMAGGVCGAYFGAKASVNFAADLRSDVYSNIQKYSFANIDKFSASSLVTRMTNDVTQLQNFIRFGMDEKTGLPYHGYQYESGVKYGIIGWGRAVGWLMIGMAESLAYMEDTRPSYEPIKQAYRRMVDKVEAYQLEGGFYSWQLGAKDGPVDTSATAMILYAIARSLNTGILIGIHKSRMMRGREALWNSVKEGKIYGALAECQGFSLYLQEYGAYPWSLGPALSLFVMTKEKQ